MKSRSVDPADRVHPTQTGCIVVVDDEAGICHLLQRVLQAQFPGYRVESFAAGMPAIAYCRNEHVTVLLTDLGLPDVHGLDVVRKVRADGCVTNVIVMTGAPTDDLPRELWDLGVAGFLDKISLGEHVRPAIERVLAGGMYFSAQIKPGQLRLPPARTTRATADAAGLSPRERDVARLVATGLLTKEIARELFLSPRTVEKHRSHVMQKVGVRSVPQLVYWCLRQGLV